MGAESCRPTEFWHLKPGEIVWMLKSHMQRNGTSEQTDKVADWKSALSAAKAEDD